MIIKHIPRKSRDYMRALEYYSQVHRENHATGHYEPVLDEHGLRQERTECCIIYINARGEDDEPENFARDCMRTNRKYGKNRNQNEVKSHEYIISHPASDREKMTYDDLEREARDWVSEFAIGYSVLIAIHRDTDNDHIHININSVREGNRPPREWMQRGADGLVLDCEIVSGGKHQQSTALRCSMSEWAHQYAKEHGLEALDSNERARQNTENRYGERNRYLLNAVEDCSARSDTPDELAALLLRDYGVTLIRRGNTVSLKHPTAEKATRLRSLGLDASNFFPDIPKGTSTPQAKQLWADYNAETKVFWDERRRVSAMLWTKRKEQYAIISERYDALRQARRNEYTAFRSPKAGFFGRLKASLVLGKSGTSDTHERRIADEKALLGQYAREQERIKSATEVYVVYSSLAKLAIRTRNHSLYCEATEWMETTRKRLADPDGVVTQREIDDAKRKLRNLAQGSKKRPARSTDGKSRIVSKEEREL